LPSSLGWKLKTPSEIQRRAPFTGVLRPGTSTATSSTSVPMNRPGAHFSQNVIGTCTATIASPLPTPMANRWRSRKWVC